MLSLKDSERTSGWPKHKLRDALLRSLETAKEGLCIFVDGLDEYEGDMLELIEFLRSLPTNIESQGAPVKICISSRPEPVLYQLLQDLPRLSISDYNKPGIRSYCLYTMEGLGPMACDGLDIPYSSSTIVARADGVFLWARFALDELIQGHSEGETREEIEFRLALIPSGLEEIYDRMLGRMKPLAKKECMAMLQLVCFIKRERNLSWQEHLMATDIAMDKDVVFRMHKNGDEDSNAYKVYAKRLRAKALGLLELIKGTSRVEAFSVKLIHRSVSSYLDQKGWQILDASGPCDLVRHESFYVETCIQYLRRLMRQLNSEENTNSWRDDEGFYKKSGLHGYEVDPPYPFLDYSARYIFEHARALEKHRVSSYALLHDHLTEQIVRLHVRVHQDYYSTRFPHADLMLGKLIFEKFDPIYWAFFHGLVSYCKSDLASRISAPGQVFWDRALRCAIRSYLLVDCERASKVLSLALENVMAVQQHHLEILFDALGYQGSKLQVAELVLCHTSVKDLRLADSQGHPVTIFWVFATKLEVAGAAHYTVILDSTIKAGKLRGEDIRRPCGPEGNLFEALIKQKPSPWKVLKLETVRDYYESMSWPCEYDRDEAERWFSHED